LFEKPGAGNESGAGSGLNFISVKNRFFFAIDSCLGIHAILIGFVSFTDIPSLGHRFPKAPVRGVRLWEYQGLHFSKIQFAISQSWGTLVQKVL
jgi:hypothetical protein